jgi:hypothetical protein
LEFCNTDLAALNLLVGTDSQSLLTRIATETSQVTLHPNDTLVSNWNITHEIQHHLQQFSFSTTLEHVTGHQDKDTLSDDLPLLAQLNVDADVLASQYMIDHSVTTSGVPRLTHNLYQLELPLGLING